MKAKKLISLVISVAMCLSVLCGLVTSSSAKVGDATNNIWTASEADAEKNEGDVLVNDDAKGTLYTVFTPLYYKTKDGDGNENPVSVGDRTFSGYISTTSNGSWNDSTGGLKDNNKCLLKFVPKADGVVTVYTLNVTSGKYLCILKDGTKDFKHPGTANGSIVYTYCAGGSVSTSAELKANETYYMFVDGSKGSFAAVDYEVGASYEQPTPAPTIEVPAETIDPNAKIYEWKVAENDLHKKKGDLLMTGLSMLFDNSSTNKTYIADTTTDGTGKITDGVAGGSSLQFIAPEDGKLEVTMIDVGSTTKPITAVIYDAQAGKNVYSYTTTGDKETVKLSAGVEKGKTYYITAMGTKGRFSAASFTPGEVEIKPDYTWAVSNADVGKKENASLMTGLTLVSDNSSTNDKYVSAAEDGTMEKDEEGNVTAVTGSALKFAAPEDGKLSVTMIDLAGGKTAVIYDIAANKNIASGQAVIEEGEEKGTVTLEADVEAGKTYYITATGTKGRFSAASFTPGKIKITWAVSKADVGKKENASLMAGLTLVSDNSSTNDKYVSAAEDGTMEKDEEGNVTAVTGSALKFVAPEDGKLSVTMIDLAGEKTAVIYDIAANKNIASGQAVIEEGEEKGTVTLEADVEAGKTYYITATGTKGRFSAASFTPSDTGDTENTPPPDTTDKPEQTDKPNQTDKPEQTDKPNQTDKPEQTDKPNQTDKPEQTDKPNQTDKPEQTDKPDETKKGGITYNGETKTVTVTTYKADVESGVLLYVTYENGIFKGVQMISLTQFAKDAESEAYVKSVPLANAESGAKLMAWDSISDMHPLCPAETIPNESQPVAICQPYNRVSIR